MPSRHLQQIFLPAEAEMQKKDLLPPNFSWGPTMCDRWGVPNNASFLTLNVRVYHPYSLCVTLDRSHFSLNLSPSTITGEATLQMCKDLYHINWRHFSTRNHDIKLTLILSPGTGSSPLHVLPHLVFLQLWTRYLLCFPFKDEIVDSRATGAFLMR